MEWNTNTFLILNRKLKLSFRKALNSIMIIFHISWKNRKLNIAHFLHVTLFVPNSAKCYLQNAECDWNQHQSCWDVAKFREAMGALLITSKCIISRTVGLRALVKAYPIWKEIKRRKSSSVPFNSGVAEQNWMGWARGKGLELFLRFLLLKSWTLWTLPQNFSSPVII